MEVFAQEGLRAASMRAIAQVAGCDPALIYYHFDSKEAMLVALLQRFFPPMGDRLEALADAADQRPLPQRLLDIMAAIREHLTDHMGLGRVIKGEMALGSEVVLNALAQHVNRNRIAVKQVLEQGVERGELRKDLDTVVATFAFMKLYVEILSVVPQMAPRLFQGDPVETVARFERQWFDIFWRGVSAHPERPISLS